MYKFLVYNVKSSSGFGAAIWDRTGIMQYSGGINWETGIKTSATDLSNELIKNKYNPNDPGIKKYIKISDAIATLFNSMLDEFNKMQIKTGGRFKNFPKYLEFLKENQVADYTNLNFNDIAENGLTPDTKTFNSFIAFKIKFNCHWDKLGYSRVATYAMTDDGTHLIKLYPFPAEFAGQIFKKFNEYNTAPTANFGYSTPIPNDNVLDFKTMQENYLKEMQKKGQINNFEYQINK